MMGRLRLRSELSSCLITVNLIGSIKAIGSAMGTSHTVVTAGLSLDFLLSARRVIEDRKSLSARYAIESEIPLARNYLGGRFGPHFIRALKGCVEGNKPIHGDISR